MDRRTFLRLGLTVGAGTLLGAGGLTAGRRLLMAGQGAGGVPTLYPNCYGFTLTDQGLQIAKGTSGQWNEALVESPMVWYDQPSGQWVMVYVGYSGPRTAPVHGTHGYATAPSPDGPWTVYGSNPFFSYSGIAGAPDENGVSGPFVWYEAGTYHLFYIGLTATGYEQGTKRLCHATSTDWVPGTNAGTWTRHGAVISPSGSGWRSTAIWHPNIIKVGPTYYLFFNATGTISAVSTERIGYATSSDLNTWVVDDVNSPLLDVGSGGSWDDAFVGDPSVYRLGDHWYMAYYGNDGSVSKDGVATTTPAAFPLGWTKYSGNPILGPGAGGTYDDAAAHKPFIVVTATTYYHFFTSAKSVSPELRQIGMASQAIGSATNCL